MKKENSLINRLEKQVIVMQIDRLFQIIYLLLGREKMTAGELAQRFEVSERTIYRDIDTLSGAGIPIYAAKGRGGGIRLLPQFILNKSVLSEKEQNEILFGLQSLSATNAAESGEVLSKLSSLFKKEEEQWIDVDFSNWGSGQEEKKRFDCIKTAILERYRITFQYFGSYGKTTSRTVEPVKLRFKNSDWYLQGFCLEKQGYRTFKIKRMSNLKRTDQQFEKRVEEIPSLEPEAAPFHKLVSLHLRFSEKLAFRVYDTFEADQIERLEDGSFLVETCYPEDDWVYSFLLSFGAEMRVLEPNYIGNILKEKAQKISNLY